MIAAAALALLFAASPMPLDELVKAAGAAELVSEAAYKDRPCTFTIDSKELDKKGGVKESSEIVLRRFLVDGKPQDELVRYVENGKDVTAEKKTKRDAEKKEHEDDGESSGIHSPFHPKAVESYTFEDLGADKADPTLRRIRFAPKKGATGDDLMIGEATLLPTARLRETRMRPATLPMLVSGVDILATFGANGEVERMEMKGEAGALFIKKRFHVVTTFDWSAAP